jgi:cytidine deaminase
MKTILFDQLDLEDQTLLQKACERLTYSLNKVTNPSTSVVVKAGNDNYFGNNIFLSNNTLICAEANALASAAAAGDIKISKLFLVIARTNAEPRIVSPCGNCRQWLHDFSRLNSGQAIEVFCATNELDDVIITSSEELLPSGFKSAGLGRMISETK